MQDLKRNRKRVPNQHIDQMENNCLEEHLGQEVDDDLTRGCGCKKDSSCDKHSGCNHNMKCECECECVCHPEPHCCEPCEPDADKCIKNKCGPECLGPITPPRFNVSNSVPVAIEANRIFDTMVFQTFTDATAPNGAPLVFDVELVEINGPIPRVGQVNVDIEKICINHNGIIINTGTTTLEDFDIEPLEPTVGRRCETTFEYAVCGETHRRCCDRGKGQSVVYKEKGLSVLVEDLVLELRGRCGCTEFIAFAFPAVKCHGGQAKRCCDVEFLFNTLSAPIGVPSDGRGFTLRQEFQTSLTVDCIGKALLSCVDHDDCDCHCELCIPNDIDLILCLQSNVSTLINEQLVVLTSPNGIQPRVVDTFSKVCDFGSCGE